MTTTAAVALPTQLALVKEELLYARERARTVCKGLDAHTWAGAAGPRPAGPSPSASFT